MMSDDVLKVALAGIVASVLTAISIAMIWERMRAKEHGFGPTTAALVGIVLLFATLIFLSVAVGIGKESITTLLGSIAGYLFGIADKTWYNKNGKNSPGSPDNSPEKSSGRTTQDRKELDDLKQ